MIFDTICISCSWRVFFFVLASWRRRRSCKSLLPGAGSSGTASFRGETHLHESLSLFCAGAQMCRGLRSLRSLTPLWRLTIRAWSLKFPTNATKPRTDQKKTNECNAKTEPRNLFNTLLTNEYCYKCKVKWRSEFLVKPLVSALLGWLVWGPTDKTKSPRKKVQKK